jgi:DNA polymerase IV
MTLNALYIDFNSYFASVEQQLRPQLRGKPIAVLAVLAETTCCIAASYEAKAFGIKTGTSVKDARALCPNIIFVEARPQLYVEHHHRLIEIVESCTPVEKVLSIDEMVCRMTGSQQQSEMAVKLVAQIKQKIAKQFAWIRCSIGIAPNTFLAKVASNMQKPDGCVLLDKQDIPTKLLKLALRDLNGIGKQMEARLNRHKIFTVADLYQANRQQLQVAWGSVEGERMYEKLRGLEPHYVRHVRSSLGHSHVLPPDQRHFEGAKAVLHRLLQKACMRLRSYELLATRVSVKIKCRGQHFERIPSWQLESELSATDNTLRMIEALESFLQHYPQENIVPYAVGISFSGLLTAEEAARDLFQVKPLENEQKLNNAIDQLNLKFGKNTVYFGGAHDALKDAPMRIAFNHIPDLKTESDQ